jgi:hypothetical protein
VAASGWLRLPGARGDLGGAMATSALVPRDVGRPNAPPESYGVHWCVFLLGRYPPGGRQKDSQRVSQGLSRPMG